jgi:hypothetical protein
MQHQQTHPTLDTWNKDCLTIFLPKETLLVGIASV